MKSLILLTIIQESILNTSPEVVEQLLRMSDDLRIAYEYYQDVLYIISQHDVKELDRLLEENIHDLPIALTKH